MKLKNPQYSSSSKLRSSIPKPDRKSVLLLVHLQNDFCPGGALAVDKGDEVIPVANEWIQFFASEGFPIVATRDWHPSNHCSFTAQGGPWPLHCVQGSLGSQFHPKLKMSPGTLIVSGATKPTEEAYSGFQGTSLEDRLEDLEAETLYVIGLATDYCIKQTVLDACRLGFRVVLLQDGVRGIDVQADDSQKALHEMRLAGAIVANSIDFGVQV